MNFLRNLVFLSLLVLSFVTAGGCSTGAAPTNSVVVSAEDMKSGTIHVASTYLNLIEKMPPQQRQLMVSKDPHVSEALKKAVAIDAATKARVDQLGVTLP